MSPPPKRSNRRPPPEPTGSPPLAQTPFAVLSTLNVPVVPVAPALAVSTAQTTAPVAKKRSLGRLLLRRETKHRGGKTVVIVAGFAAPGALQGSTLSEIEKLLKQRLGCGGSVDEGKREILIQGDRPAEVATLLRELGYEVGGVTARP